MVSYGSDIKYKSRLVSKGFSQFQGLDYIDTFAPIAKTYFIRLVLAIAASKRWEVHHMDVKSEFIHGEIQEDIYMHQLEGLIEYNSLVCKQPSTLGYTMFLVLH